MIQTICARTPEDLDLQVNTFEKAKGVSRHVGEPGVFAVQTHFTPAQSEGSYDAFVAVVFYR